MIIILLREEGDEEGCQLSGRLRALLSRWLTTPVEFDRGLLESLETIGVGARLEARWGERIGAAYKAACGAVRELAGTPNPLREKLKELVDGIVRGREDLRIYCHPSAVTEFQFLIGESRRTLPECEIFLTTQCEYRDSDIFDVLVKVGPLRSRGWGAVPDAVLTAPRFSKLVQIVWSGCQDEPYFGYDPVNLAEETELINGLHRTGGIRAMSWKTTISQTGSDFLAPGLNPDEDDFQILSELGRSGERRRCVLVHFREQQGVLYSPRADVLSFDPFADADHSIDFRTSVDGLSGGMFVIEEHFHDSGAAGGHAEEGEYGRIWKQSLLDKLLFDNAFSLDKLVFDDVFSFITKLRKDGIDLLRIDQSIWHWSKPATSVVHAPQQRKHFEILIRNLDIDCSETWIAAAWHEVIKTRGKAIQTGMQEHRVAYERLMEFLNTRLPELHSEAKNNYTFNVSIPSLDDMSGMIVFHKIVAIEEGFLAPDCNLGKIYNLEEIEQWRE